MKWLKIAVLMFMLITFYAPPVASIAQEPVECDIEAIKGELVSEVAETTDLTALSSLLTEYEKMLFVCNNGYIWDEIGDTTLGPIHLDKGNYFLEYKSTVDIGETFNYFNVHLVSVSDESESENYLIGDDFDAIEEREGEQVELSGGALLRLNGGTYLFKVETLNYPIWTITLAPIE